MLDTRCAMQLCEGGGLENAASVLKTKTTETHWLPYHTTSNTIPHDTTVLIPAQEAECPAALAVGVRQPSEYGIPTCMAYNCADAGIR